MSLSPSNVITGLPVSLAFTGDTYNAEIAAVTPSGKTITLESGQKARWNEKRSRFQIGQSDSRGYATLVISRVAERQDPTH